VRADLSAAEVVAWLRHQAMILANMADTIESTFNLGLPPQSKSIPIVANQTTCSQPPTSETPEAVVQAIKKFMDGRARRLSDIALALRQTEESIEPLLTSENGFVKADRGWYKIDSAENIPTNGQPMLLA
jgi:hypothetical protein